MATPQSYPLSVNALRSACNQSTNRDPITAHDEATISAGLKELASASLVRAAYARRSSTPRYEHTLGDHLEIGPPALAVLCVLLLRGPQTVGELRLRTERLHGFGELAEVQQVLTDLADHHYGALVEEQPRQPGQKEARWRHLLGAESVEGEGEEPSTAPPEPAAPAGPAPEVVELQRQVLELLERVQALEARLARDGG